METATSPTLVDRALGSYLGLAVGDALGATVEFMTAREISAVHGIHSSIVGGGWLRLKRGQVTDDTTMSLALGKALIQREAWDLQTVAEQFAVWLRACPVDVGGTCRRGIRRYMHSGSLATPESEMDAGNGAAMRNLPVVLASLDDDEKLKIRSLEQAHVTHCNRLSDAGTLALARMTRALILGGGVLACRRIADRLLQEHPQFRFDPWPGRTSGYIVDTVQTVLHAFFRNDSVETCVVDVVNHGGDADTTGALAGMLAGACYGVQGIPDYWLKRLDPRINREIREQVPALLRLSYPQLKHQSLETRPPEARRFGKWRRGATRGLSLGASPSNA